MQTRQYQAQAIPAIDTSFQHAYHYRRHRDNRDSACVSVASSDRYPHPYPPHLVLERSPSQPSLTNSNTTDVSDEHATTPTTPMHKHYRDPLTTPPSSDKDLALYGSPQSKLPMAGAFLDSDPPSFTSTPHDSSAASFTDKRQRRLSLSRSFQNLRDKADKAARRRSTVSTHKSTPPFSELPPVPTLPAIYRKTLDIEVQDHRRTASATATMQTTVATPKATPTRQPAPQRQSSGSSLGKFFRKLTGRKTKEKPRAPPPLNLAPAEPPVGTLNRRTSELKPVPKAPAPASVQGVLAEMGASSAAAAERKSVHRKSVIKRVPVPIYDFEEDVIIPRRSADKAKVPPMPANAAEARHAALMALEGSPKETKASLPSDEPPTPDVKRPSTFSNNSDEDHIIKMVPAPPPMVTHVIVMEPKTFDSDVDLSNDEISPRKQSIKLVPSRSQSGSSSGSCTVDSLRRMSRTQNLSDFGTYDSSSDGSDEGGDVALPLQLRIPPPQPATETSSLSPRSPRTPISSYLPVTPEDGPGPSTPTSSGFDHSTASHNGAEFGTYSYNDGHGLKRTSTYSSAPRSPYSTTSHVYNSSNGGHSPRDARFAGSRSAYVAPVGDGLSSDSHGRNASIRLRAATSLVRRASQRPKEPPTSHDAYMARQAELANRRQSCKPMIHSQASIAAELTEVRDKEEGRVMETFFMS